MTIDLTNAEAEVLLQLLDVANKAAGLAVSENCLHFQRKIKEAAYNVQTRIVAEEPVIPFKRSRGRPRNAIAKG